MKSLASIRRHPRTALRPQFQTTECGIGVMRIMLAYFGRTVSAGELRVAMGVSRDCLSASDIKRAAAAYGLECRASRAEPEALAQRRLPVVVHLNFIHFVVLEAVGRDYVRLNCPAAGRIDLLRPDFDNAFTGIVLEMTPGPDFRADASAGSGNGEAAWWRGRLLPHLAPLALGLSAAASRGAAVVGLAYLLAQGAADPFSFAAVLGLVALLGGIAAACFRRFGRRFVRDLREDLSAHLRGVSAAFHAYRLPDVLFALFEAVRDGGSQLESRVAPALAALLECMVLIGGASLLLPSAGAILALVFAAWCVAVSALSLYGRRLERGTPVGREGDIQAAIAAMEQPAAHRIGSEGDTFRFDWMGRLASQRLLEAFNAPVSALLAASPFALTLAGLVAVMLALPGDARAASGLALLGGALGLASGPLSNLRGVLGAIRRLGQKSADVLDEPIEAVHGPPLMPVGARLEVRGVSFRFNPKGPPVVGEVSLVVGEGEQVGLRGPSGGGKSTLVGVALGLHRPEAGLVLLGGVPIERVPPELRARRLALVDRRPVIFEGTIRENLVLDDPTITEADIRAAIRDSSLAPVLATRPDGLDAAVEAFGRNFSGGELRRLGIARALARNPTLLVLDDAVDDLDLETEMRIRAALRRRRCALILVTHRAASLEACDRLVHIDGRKAFAPPTVFFAAKDRSAVFQHETAPHCEREVGSLLDKVMRETYAVPTPCRPGADEKGDRPSLVLGAVRCRGLQARPIRLRRRFPVGVEFGPLLAFRHDGKPVLLRHVNGAFQLDGSSSEPEAARFAAAGMQGFDEEAFELSRAAPDPATSPRGWRQALAGGRTREYGTLALLALAGATALAGVPLAIATTPAPVAAGLALSAAGCFWLQALNVRDRLFVELRRADAEATSALLGRISGDAARRRRPVDVVLGLHGLWDILDWTQTAASKGIASAILAATALFSLTVLAGGATSALAAALALLWLIPCAACVAAGRAAEEPQLSAGLAMRRRLLVLLSSMMELRLLAADGAMIARWSQEDGALMDVERRYARLRDAASALKPAVALALVMALCAGATDPAHALALAWLGWLLALALRGLGEAITEGDRKPVREKAAAELLAAPRETGRLSTHNGGVRLQCTAVGYRYPGSSRLVLSSLDLAIDLRGITVLTGPSGGGKSTLLQLLLGLAKPSAGRIQLDGRRLGEIDLADWRRGMAAVFQGDGLDRSSTIRGHLCRSGSYDLSAMWAALDLVDLSDEVSAMPMGIQTIVGPDSLSAGQQQRLLIARALIGRPRLLILDEGTNAIPDALQAQLLERLRVRGIGCLTVTHRETLIYAADEIHFIDGTCRFSGTSSAFLRRADLLARVAEERMA